MPASGDIAGEAGTTIGWGYSITNPSATDWLMLSDLGSDVFFNATVETLFLFPILAPGQTGTLAFSAGTDGLLQLTWNALAPVAFTNGGQFVFKAEFWDEDPLGTGSFLSSADDQFASYSATVSAPATVPEPATLLLIVTGLGATGLLERRRRRRTMPAGAASRA
jgi:hypothetical protein